MTVAKSLAASPLFGISPPESVLTNCPMKHTAGSACISKTLPWQSLSGIRTTEYHVGQLPPRDFSDGKLKRYWERPSTNGRSFHLKILKRFTRWVTDSVRGWSTMASRKIETIQSKVWFSI